MINLTLIRLTHFALFVWFCREVDLRRKQKRKREIEALYPEYGKYGSEEMVMYNMGEGVREERVRDQAPALEGELLRSSTSGSERKSRGFRARIWYGFKNATVCLAVWLVWSSTALETWHEMVGLVPKCMKDGKNISLTVPISS